MDARVLLRPYLEQLTKAEGVKVEPAVFPLVVRAGKENGSGSSRDWAAKGVPAELGGQLAALPYLEPCPDIIEVARERKLRPVDVAERQCEAAHHVGVEPLTVQHPGDVVDRGRIGSRDDAVDVYEEQGFLDAAHGRELSASLLFSPFGQEGLRWCR